MSNLVTIPASRGHSNHALVARSLGIDVITGRIAVGDRLPSDADLTGKFGISRPVLREAVKTLAAKGMLASKTRVGTVVRESSAWNMFDADVLAWHLDAGIGIDFLRDLADIRLAVEPHAAALAALRRTAADLASLAESLRWMRAAPFSSHDFANADLALHLAVATASGNRFMRSIGAVIEAALRASFLLSAPLDDSERAIVIEAHERIVDRIEACDPQAASSAMSAVIQNGLRRHGALGPRRPTEQAWLDRGSAAVAMGAL